MTESEFLTFLLNKGLCVNENQLELITTVEGPVVGVACAGSGKTTSMLGSLIYMTEVLGVDPSKILVLTFSKSAVEDIKAKYENLTREFNRSRSVEFRTFHSLFFYLLRLFSKKSISVVDDIEKSKMLRACLSEVGFGGDDELLGKIMSLMSFRINNCMFDFEEFYNSPKFLFEGVPREIFEEVYKLYTKEKAKSYSVDFDDLQEIVYKLLLNKPHYREEVQKLWEYYIIDEFQDVSKIQIEILKMLIKPENYKNIKVVGDDDQAIYGWRGSDNRFLLNFDSIFKESKKVFIDTNYRCPSNILELAKECISKNRIRFDKEIKAAAFGGSIWLGRGESLKEISQKDADKIESLIAAGVSPSDIAVLYRDHTSPLFLIDLLLRKNIPVKLKSTNGLIFNSKIVLEVFDVLDFVENPNKEENFIKATTKCIPRYTKQQAIKDSEKLKALGWKASVSVKSLEQKLVVDSLANAIEFVGSGDISKALSFVFQALENRREVWSKYFYYTSEEIDDIFDYLIDLAWFKTPQKFREEFEARRERLIMMTVLNESGVNVMTMHSAKGLEFNSVFVLNVTKDRFPNEAILRKMENVYGYEEAEKLIEEERRLFYVAMTRAKENLFISYIKNPSMFLDEIFSMKEFPYILEY